MRPRNREINIFNISMLDTIAGALGVFLIIMIVLFPYYRQETIDYQAVINGLRAQLEAAQHQARQAQEEAHRAQEEARQAQAAAEQVRQAQETARQAQAEAAQARGEAQRSLQQAQAAEQRLAKTFLVAYIMWSTPQDVDLHVVDPSGAEFYFERKTHSPRPGELSEDNTLGPGTEIWEVREAPPGVYRLFANLYSDQGQPSLRPDIRGRVFYRDGSQPLPPLRLPRVGEKKPLATLTVGADGSVEFR